MFLGVHCFSLNWIVKKSLFWPSDSCWLQLPNSPSQDEDKIHILWNCDFQDNLEGVFSLVALMKQY